MTIAVAGLALSAFPVFAEEVVESVVVEEETKTDSDSAVTSKEGNEMKDVRTIRQQKEKEIKIKRIKENEKRVASSTIVSREKQARKEFASSTKEMDSRREEFKQKFDAKKEEVKKKFEEEKVNLSEKLKTIKDEKKKEIVQKISEQFQEINTKRLEHFSKVLGQMEEVLVKVKTRVEKAKDSGADTGVLNDGITAFETAVASARASIVAQSAKVYSIEITTEDNLKSNTGATRQSLQSDLKIVAELVKTAHESLKNIAKEMAKIRIVDDKVRPASSDTATTTVNQ